MERGADIGELLGFGVDDPDDIVHAFGEEAVLLFAGAEGFFGLFALGDVAGDGEEVGVVRGAQGGFGDGELDPADEAVGQGEHIGGAFVDAGAVGLLKGVQNGGGDFRRHQVGDEFAEEQVLFLEDGVVGGGVDFMDAAGEADAIDEVGQGVQDADETALAVFERLVALFELGGELLQGGGAFGDLALEADGQLALQGVGADALGLAELVELAEAVGHGEHEEAVADDQAEQGQEVDGRELGDEPPVLCEFDGDEQPEEPPGGEIEAGGAVAPAEHPDANADGKRAAGEGEEVHDHFPGEQGAAGHPEHHDQHGAQDDGEGAVEAGGGGGQVEEPAQIDEHGEDGQPVEDECPVVHEVAPSREVPHAGVARDADEQEQHKKGAERVVEVAAASRIQAVEQADEGQNEEDAQADENEQGGQLLLLQEAGGGIGGEEQVDAQAGADAHIDFQRLTGGGVEHEDGRGGGHAVRVAAGHSRAVAHMVGELAVAEDEPIHLFRQGGGQLQKAGCFTGCAGDEGDDGPDRVGGEAQAGVLCGERLEVPGVMGGADLLDGLGSGRIAQEADMGGEDGRVNFRLKPERGLRKRWEGPECRRQPEPTPALVDSFHEGECAPTRLPAQGGKFAAGRAEGKKTKNGLKWGENGGFWCVFEGFYALFCQKPAHPRSLTPPNNPASRPHRVMASLSMLRHIPLASAIFPPTTPLWPRSLTSDSLPSITIVHNRNTAPSPNFLIFPWFFAIFRPSWAVFPHNSAVAGCASPWRLSAKNPGNAEPQLGLSAPARPPLDPRHSKTPKTVHFCSFLRKFRPFSPRFRLVLGPFAGSHQLSPPTSPHPPKPQRFSPKTTHPVQNCQ